MFIWILEVRSYAYQLWIDDS